MTRRSILRFMAVMVALLALAAPSFAGGWAVVTLDSLPYEVRAGETLVLGFMVRQHGKTPINTEKPPYLSASNKDKDAGKSLTATARQEGATGHYVVEVTFPSAGAWEWEITPPPFDGTKFAPLTVLPAAPAAQPAQQPVAQPTTGGFALASLRIPGAVLLVIAVALALASQARISSRLRALRSR